MSWKLNCIDQRIEGSPAFFYFLSEYKGDINSFSIDHFNFKLGNSELPYLTGDHLEVDKDLSVSIRAAIYAIHFLLTNLDAKVCLVSPDRAFTDAVMSQIHELWPLIIKRSPWLGDYFSLSKESLFNKQNNYCWLISTKSYSDGCEEVLAGEFAERMLFVVGDHKEMSGRAMRIIHGTLTQPENYLLLA